ncbi:MAG TPA: hypothetical protein VFO67_17650, partial [Gemmatimonadales bacterium]|nr:hypothetical protein [Gemmatimonadales bacterium]
VAMIGVHQLAGPICFQWALRRTGEFTQVEGTHDRTSVGTSSGSATVASAANGTTGVVTAGSGVY